MKKTYVKLCPNCRSEEVRFEATDAGVFYICKKCGLRLPSFPEVKIDIKKKK